MRPTALWVDAQLSPALATWLPGLLSLPVVHVRDLGLRDASDEAIFSRAREMGVGVVTKDADFQFLIQRFGPPPRILWLTCGNTSNAAIRVLIERFASDLRTWLDGSEPLIEIR